MYNIIYIYTRICVRVSTYINLCFIFSEHSNIVFFPETTNQTTSGRVMGLHEVGPDQDTLQAGPCTSQVGPPIGSLSSNG